jgi:hypothetical protein
MLSPRSEFSGEPLAWSRDDMVVKVVSVQGGEAHIDGQTAAFARIVMSGNGLGERDPDVVALGRQVSVVLTLEIAQELVNVLDQIVNRIVRSSPTPTVRASGNWSWTTHPPQDEDLSAVAVSAKGVALKRGGEATPTVQVDFAGTLVTGLSSTERTCHVQGAVMSNVRQAQTLASSLKKFVRSALAKQRVEVYVTPEPPRVGDCVRPS